MSLDFNTRVTDRSKDEWLTPPAIIAALGEFDLDPCSPVIRPWDTAKTHFDIHADGLKQPWFGRVWMNPPYGDETFIWMKKLADHGKTLDGSRLDQFFPYASRAMTEFECRPHPKGGNVIRMVKRK